MAMLVAIGHQMNASSAYTFKARDIAELRIIIGCFEFKPLRERRAINPAIGYIR